MNIFVIKAHVEDYDGGTSYLVKAFNNKENAESYLDTLESLIQSKHNEQKGINFSKWQCYGEDKATYESRIITNLDKMREIDDKYLWQIKEFDPGYAHGNYEIQEIELV